MTTSERIERAEGLAWLVSHLAGGEFGGTPACAEADAELFFPVSELHTRQIEAAKQVCRSCPVRGSCLQQALRRPEHGIWGGTTEGERRRLSRARITKQDQDGEITEGVQAA